MRFQRPELLWVGLIGLILLLAVWWIPGEGRGESDSFSHAFGGKSVFLKLIEELEGDTIRSVEQLAPYEYEYGRLVVLGPARYPHQDQWDLLYDDVWDYGASLLFAAAADDPSVNGDVFGISIEPDRSQLQADEERDWDTGPVYAETELVDGTVEWKSSAHLEFDRPDLWEVLVSCEERPQVARREFGEAFVVFCASDEIFSNAAMTEPKRAELAYRIFEACETDYAVTCYDESLNRSGAPKVLGLLFEPTLRPLTLQALLVLVLFAWAGSVRFGPVRQLTDSRRRSIEEHAEALGLMYYQSKAGDRSVKSLADFVTFEMVRLGGPTLHANSAEAIAKLSREDVDSVRLLLSDIHSAKNRNLKNPQAGLILKKLAKILEGMRSRQRLE